MWIGLLHHVVNEHEWVLEEGVNGGECPHEPLGDDERNKPWLKKESPADKALTKIVMDKRFLNTIPYYVNFRYVLFIMIFAILKFCKKNAIHCVQELYANQFFRWIEFIFSTKFMKFWIYYGNTIVCA